MDALTAAAKKVPEDQNNDGGTGGGSGLEMTTLVLELNMVDREMRINKS